ncbi:hypothetical protein N8Z33_00875 [Flavobacteriaceae bacterium]|nr:hypothetical protein [Flavobacteriaceae bacterium]
MQEIIPNTKDRILYLAEKQELSKQKFFTKIGSVYGNFTGKSKNSEPGNAVIREILLNYPDVNPDWLVTGRGEMLLTSDPKPYNLGETEASIVAEPHFKYKSGIPLVAAHAVAGFGNNTFSIEDKDVKAQYIIPAFKHKKVNFMIEIDGSSMYPKYNSGDIIACTILKERQFLQWNKVHVVATKEQGIIVKRVHEGSNGSLKMVSDNANYPPFEVPEDQITGIALVVGVIRLE